MDINSTNVRSVREAPASIRALIGLGARIAPRFTERQAARLFLTPRLRKGKSMAEHHAELLPERSMERRAGEGEAAYPELSTGRVAVWSWGRGPTVLLVHGWSGNAGDMAPIAAELVRAGYRTVLFDMPGHGGSSPRPTNLYVYLRTLEALGEVVGPLEAVVGHSLGGTATALALGQRLLAAKKGVLIAPAVSPWAFSWDFARMIGLPRERVPGMVARTEELVGAKADGLDAAEAVRGLVTPVHIAHDPEDLDVPFEHSTRLAAAWRDSVLIPRPGLGHRKILKDGETIQGVVEFVRGGA
jgi:pimeloyl-ACP methyl ester carboxylesterase